MISSVKPMFGPTFLHVAVSAVILAGVFTSTIAAAADVPAIGSAAQVTCTGGSVARMELQTARLIRANERFAAWALADNAGRCYGMAALAQRDRRHYEYLYLAGAYCLLAYGAGKDEPALAASDDGSLLLENDLVYSAGVLQSIASDDKAPTDIRSNAGSILARLMVAIRPAGKKMERR